MSITPLSGRATPLSALLAIGFASAFLAAAPASAGAGSWNGSDVPSWDEQSWMEHSGSTPDGKTRSRANSRSSQQSSASAWSQSDGDHGITVTTTRTGDSTSCMVVEWKREEGRIKKWQYRCDTGRP